MIYNAAVIQKHIYIAFHYDMIYNTSSNILIDPLFFLGKEEGDAYEGTFHGCIFNIIYFTCKEDYMKSRDKWEKGSVGARDIEPWK